ncbi:hypothetical protein [Collimonas fungivorans]|uniref:hypothetical protein n=1 Tax=Collimonas fungivorans TaxID=158899 RepID=UPI003FA36FD1
MTISSSDPPKHYTDGHLLQEFRNGNRLALATVCQIAATDLQQTGHLPDPEIAMLICGILTAIGAGAEPNVVFKWNKNGRPKENHTFRNWNIAMEVRSLIESGISFENAVQQVAGATSEEFDIDDDSVREIYKKLKKTLPKLPDDIFPIPRIKK